MQSEVANKTECGLLGDLRWHRRPTGQLPRKRRAPCAEAIGIRTCGNCPDTRFRICAAEPTATTPAAFLDLDEPPRTRRATQFTVRG